MTFSCLFLTYLSRILPFQWTAVHAVIYLFSSFSLHIFSLFLLLGKYEIFASSKVGESGELGVGSEEWGERSKKWGVRNGVWGVGSV